MSRNEQFFNVEPTIDIQRSGWTTQHTHKTTFNAGDLVPFFVDTDILPGMTIKQRSTFLIRTQTPLYPTMDNMYFDYYYFKVPYWTIWPNCKKFFGENEDGAWANTTEYEVPMFKTTTTRKVGVKDINCYMGIPINIPNIEFNQLGVRAYIRAYNFWFRDQNLIAPVKYNEGDDTINCDDTTATGGKLLKVAKFHDYFTSALPAPQKGDAVSMPIGTTAEIKGTSTAFNMPVIGNGKSLGLTDNNKNYGIMGRNVSGVQGFVFATTNANGKSNGTSTTDTGTANANLVLGVTNNKNNSGLIATTTGNTIASSGGLYADLTTATAATINAMRLAFATQRILEKNARFGTRYNEIIRGQFGVNSPNASLHIPEYMGGKRVPINITQVLQNGATDAQSPLGHTGAFSLTVDSDVDFTKSFDEHCVLLGVCCIRAEHTYQQGIARMWSRKRNLDLYSPSLAHLGNMPIYNREIFAQGKATDNEVFGYKEAWAEYKYKPNRISGELLSTYTKSLDAWHYGDKYNSLPVLSQQWIEEPYEFIDRTLAVPAATADQFIMDCYIEQDVYAPMPVHCTPGLIDHY